MKTHNKKFAAPRVVIRMRRCVLLVIQCNSILFSFHSASFWVVSFLFKPSCWPKWAPIARGSLKVPKDSAALSPSQSWNFIMLQNSDQTSTHECTRRSDKHAHTRESPQTSARHMQSKSSNLKVPSAKKAQGKHFTVCITFKQILYIRNIITHSKDYWAFEGLLDIQKNIKHSEKIIRHSNHETAHL